jgi:hypothetical protein
MVRRAISQVHLQRADSLRRQPYPQPASKLRDNLSPDGDHADEQHDGCKGGSFLNKRLQHDPIPLEHNKNIVPFLFSESSGVKLSPARRIEQH